MQIFGAATRVVLSLMRLEEQDFGEEAQNNQKFVLVVFYILALAEALIFLLEMGYWTWKIQHEKLFMQVIKELEFGPLCIVFLRLFFFDAYSKCISGSIFDELTMDPISFAGKLFDSNSLNNQVIGAKILQQFVEDKRFSVETLYKIESSYPLIRQMFKVLIRRYPEEKDKWHSVSHVIAKLTSQNVQSVVAIPKAVESIASMLQTRELTLYGLSILKHIAGNHDGCQMIQNKQNLLARIIDLTLLCNEQPPESHIKEVRRALKVLKNLVTATGETGRALQRDISESKFFMSKVQISLKCGSDHLKILLLGLEILVRLGKNEEVEKKKLLITLEIFFLSNEKICNQTGELLELGLYDNKYMRMLQEKDDVLKRLVAALGNPVLRVNAIRILVVLLGHSDLWSFDEIQIVAEKMPMVWEAIMKEKEDEKLLEASIVLAMQILKFKKVKVNPNEIEIVENEDFVRRLVEIFRISDNPNSEDPQMKIFMIRLIFSVADYGSKYIKLFMKLKIETKYLEFLKLLKFYLG